MAKKKPIVSPLGQWAYPGEVTIIPSSNITMKGVNYPVLGVDDLGNSQMMMPGQDYNFPGDYVTEIPQMGKGGLAQWFAEEWTDVKTGKPCGRSGDEKGSRPYPACRPKKRVNETTPKTTSEMSSAEKAKFKREKTSGKRIDYNHKRREDGGETWLDQYQDGGIETSTFLNPDKLSEVYIKPKSALNRFFNSFVIPNTRERNYTMEDALRDHDFSKKIDFSEVPVDRNFSNSDFEAAYNWTKKYMSSPRYRDMLQGKDEDSQIEVGRAYNLLTIPTELNRLTDGEINRGIGGYSSSISGSITVNPLSSPNFFKNEVLPHEISHSVDRPKSNVSWARLIPEQDTAEISKRIRKNPNVESIGFWQDHGNTPEEGAINYYSDPTEVRARLNSTRKLLNQNFGVDVFNDKIKYKDLNKFEIFNNDNAIIHQDYEDLKSLYNEDDLLWLLNNVSKTEQPKLNIAKYGGWLEEYQRGGWAGWTPNVGKPYMRTSPAGNVGYTDNTRVVNQNTNVSAANRKAAEAAEYAKRVGSISQGRTKSAYEKAREASSLVAQAEQRKGSADPLDYVLDMVNPATYGFAGTDLIGNTAMGVNNLAKGNFSEAAGNAFDAGMNALYLLPAKGVAKAIASPIAFRPVEGMMYRGLGKEGFRDAIESGVFRPKQLNYSPGRSLAEKANSPKQFSSTYYAPSKKFGVVERYGSDYVAEVPYNEADFFRRYSKRNDWSYSTPRQIPITEGRILQKDWLRGYKPIYQDGGSFTNLLKLALTPEVRGIVANQLVDKGVTKVAQKVGDASKQQIFDRYRPIDYPDPIGAIVNSGKDIPLRDLQGDYHVSEEAWRLALGLPTKSKYISPSKYRPTKASDPNAQYYSLNNVYDPQKLIDAYIQKAQGKPGQTVQMDALSPYIINQDMMTTDNEIPFTQTDPLQKFSLSQGEDERGRYISIYDKYDFNVPYMDAVVYGSDRKPYEFYDRFYYKKDAAGKPVYVKQKKYGGWLDTYQDGGENLPELNSKIDIANFYKNPLSEKYGIYQDPTDKGYKYYLKSQGKPDLDLSTISNQRLKETNIKKGFLPETKEINIKSTSPIILPETRNQILRDRLYNEQNSLMEEISNEIPIIPPSYKEVLQSIPKVEDTKVPVKKYNTLPNKQRPAKAELNKNIELNPVQKFYADRMYEKYGKVILTDKANNRTIYGTKKSDGSWDLNSFEVLTGQNPNFNDISNLSVEQLGKNRSKRGTPIGLFSLEADDDIYGYPGLRLNNTGNIAYHITYKGPDDLYRSALYNNNNNIDNYRSYGCINCEKPSLEALLKFANPEDKALIINSNLGFKNNENWIKKNSPELYKELFKKQGGQTGWLNKYK